MSYLGLEYSKLLNEKTYEPKEVANIANLSSKPILVMLTDEAAELASRTEQFVKN